jgi:hypothetical protein
VRCVASSRYAASATASRWTLDHISSKMNPPNRLDNVKRYPALPSSPMFATGMKMAKLDNVRASYTPHFSRHNITMATFMRHIGAMPNGTVDPDAYDDVDTSTPPVSVSGTHRRVPRPSNHACMHALMRTHTCMHARAQTHIQTHTRTHTYTHTHTNKHTHTHTHTHTHLDSHEQELTKVLTCAPTSSHSTTSTRVHHAGMARVR